MLHFSYFQTVAIFFAAAIAVCYGGLLAPAPAVAAYAAPAYAAYAAAPAAALAYAAPYPYATAPYAYAAPAAVREDSLVVGPSGSIASSRVSPGAVAYYG